MTLDSPECQMFSDGVASPSHSSSSMRTESSSQKFRQCAWQCRVFCQRTEHLQFVLIMSSLWFDGAAIWARGACGLLGDHDGRLCRSSQEGRWEGPTVFVGECNLHCIPKSSFAISRKSTGPPVIKTKRRDSLEDADQNPEYYKACIFGYGSVSKPCTPGEHQNSW